MIKTYRYAFVFFLAISFLIIDNHEIITRDWVGGNGRLVTATTNETTELPPIVKETGNVPPPPTEAVSISKRLFQTNVLAFIYLGGLAGGLFSVVTRINRKELLPGDDLYFREYVLTKPFVGAFGAIVLFILFAGGLTEFNLVPPAIELIPNGAVFGISFLLGFSERYAFPSLQPA